MQQEIGRADVQVPAGPEAIVTELFTTPQGRTNPYPLYRQLRDQAPVYRSSLGMWLLSRYDDCATVLNGSRLGKNYARQNDTRIGPKWREHIATSDAARSMVNLDGPEHERLHRLVAKAFTRTMVDRMRPGIEASAERLLDPLAEAGGGNLLEALAFPLTLGVVGDMLGVPEADRPQFPPLLRDLLGAFETRASDAQFATSDRAHIALRDYFRSLVAEKRRTPGADFLTELTRTEENGDRLDDEELWLLAVLLFGAGFESTALQIGNSILGLLMYPQEIAELRAHPPLLRTLPDELLRYDGTAQMVARVTEAPIDLGTTTIPAGETILVLLGAANRDPARYVEPDRLSVSRSGVRPLSLGGGAHFCIGAALARAELEIAIRALLERFEHIDLRSQPRFRDRLALRGLEELEVDVVPARAR